MVAFALRADGWYLRSDIIWAKPNPMPESVTDRPTKAHEYVFLLTKSPRCFYDAEAIREPHQEPWRSNGKAERNNWSVGGTEESRGSHETVREYNPAGRNRRSVWNIATEPYPEAHFATFPQALVEPCIKAGTSERGCCPECGAPWVRVVEREPAPVPHPYNGKHGTSADPNAAASRIDANKRARREQGFPHDQSFPAPRSIGWKSSCLCTGLAEGASAGFDAGHATPSASPVPCVVLDPFLGSGTTAMVARRLGRRCVGIELNPEYAELAARRLQQLSLLA